MKTRAEGSTAGKLAGWLTLVGVLAALNYSSRLLADGTVDGRDLVYRWSSVAGALVQFGIMLALVLWIARGGSVRELLALRRPAGWGTAAGLAVGIFLATLALAALLEPILPAGEEQGLTPDGWDGSRAPQFVANFVVIAGFAPIAEELTFRGLGASLLLPRLGTYGAVVAVGLLFGLAHGLVFALPILAFFGAALAWLRFHTDSVLPCIAAHAIFNGFALIASVAA